MVGVAEVVGAVEVLAVGGVVAGLVGAQIMFVVNVEGTKVVGALTSEGEEVNEGIPDTHGLTIEIRIVLGLAFHHSGLVWIRVPRVPGVVAAMV